MTETAPLACIPEEAAVLAELDRILATQAFQHSKRYPTFLRYVVEQTLRGAKDELKERTLGVSVFRRSTDYDTSADPVVRNTASEVRKRLQDYYAHCPSDAKVLIFIPSGTYVPEFRPVNGNTLTPATQSPGQNLLAPFRVSRKWTLRFSVAAALGLIASVGFGFLRKDPPSKVFWAPILNAADPILVVTDTWGKSQEPQKNGDSSSTTRATIDPHTFLFINEQSAKLASFLIGNGKHMDYELARNVSVSKLRAQPFILRGAFNNQWTIRAVSPLRFYFQLDREAQVRRLLDRQNPDRRDWNAPLRQSLTEDYALLARAPEAETGQMMLVIAGLGEQGSAAALEFATNPKYLERFSAQAPARWSKRNIELVLQTKLVNGDWGEPHVVATHVW